jgi:hypothetical protein
MNAVLFHAQRKPITLNFIPDRYQEQFTTEVLRYYAVAAEHSTYSSKHTRHLPEIISDIADMNKSFFLIGALACETGNPTAFHDRMDGDFEEDEFFQQFDELVDQYNPNEYGDYHCDFADDIESILNYFNMSYMTVFYHVFSQQVSLSEIHNYALVGVW